MTVAAKNKYRSLEHIIYGMLAKEAVGVSGTDKFQGNQGIQVKSSKMSVPAKNLTGPQAISKPPVVPNQGDQADTNIDMISRESGGGKKKIKEDTNTDLIKKGANLLNKGPLTQYTNPQTNQPSGVSDLKPSLSFQTPDLSGNKDDDEIETPKLKAGQQKKTSDNVTTKMKTPANDPKLAKAEKETNKVLKSTPAATSTIGASPNGAAAPLNTPAAAPGAPTAVAAATGKPETAAPSGGGVQSGKATNPPGIEGLTTNQFIGQQQATPPVSPGGGMAGNSAKGGASPSLDNPSAPSKGSAPIDVVGKKPGETPKISTGTDAAAGAIALPDYKNLPLTKAATTVAAMRNPQLPPTLMKPVVDTLPPIKVTPDSVTGEFSDKEKKGNDTSAPKKEEPAGDKGSKPASPLDAILGKETQAQRDQYNKERDEKATKEKGEQKPTSDNVTKNDAGKVPESKEDKDKYFGSMDYALKHLLGQTTPEEDKAYDEWRTARQPEDRESTAKKSLALGLLGGGLTKGMLGGLRSMFGAGTAAGAAAGGAAGAAGSIGMKGLEALGLLKYLFKGHQGEKGTKPGQFVYGTPGQISGTPTRQKGGGGMREEVENLDKVRRAVELVGRRHGDNRKKSSLGRQSAIKTRIIDEMMRTKIMREAIKEKQDKDKKLKPGEHKTPVDLHPKIKEEPNIDNVRQ